MEVHVAAFPYMPEIEIHSLTSQEMITKFQAHETWVWCLTYLAPSVKNFAYDGYLKYAYPYDELKPLSCDVVDTWRSYSLTLIDALDTLAIKGNYTEFRRVFNLEIWNSTTSHG